VLQSFEGLYRSGNEFVTVKILYHPTITERMQKVNVKSPFLFDYKDVSGRLNIILNHWFDVSTKRNVIMDLYFGVMYNVDSYLSNNLVMLFTALEVYHRSYLDAHSTKKIEKNAFVDKLFRKIDRYDLSNIEKIKLKGWIEEKRQLAFKERFEEVYDEFAEILPYLSSKIGSKNEFIRKIVRYRNDLSHGNISYDNIDNDELFWLYKDLQLALQLCLLSKIGFSMEEINRFYLLDELKKVNRSEGTK
jgi:hypothetical protein